MFRSWFRSVDMDPFDVWKDPFREARAVRRAMNRWFGIPTYAPSNMLGRPDFEVDVTERPEEFEVKAVLPGLRPQDIEVNIAKDLLTISAKWPETDEEGVHYLLRERMGGHRERQLRFPLPVETGEVEAGYENGILSVRVPKAEEVRPRRIKVKRAAPHLLASREGDVIDGEARLVED